jgi:hypothetical protein
MVLRYAQKSRPLEFARNEACICEMRSSVGVGVGVRAIQPSLTRKNAASQSCLLATACFAACERRRPYNAYDHPGIAVFRYQTHFQSAKNATVLHNRVEARVTVPPDFYCGQGLLKCYFGSDQFSHF